MYVSCTLPVVSPQHHSLQCLQNVRCPRPWAEADGLQTDRGKSVRNAVVHYTKFLIKSLTLVQCILKVL